MADKPTVIVTPPAFVTGWVSILKADTKYNDAGEYKIRVKIPKDTKGLSAQLEAIETAAAQEKAKWLKDPKNKGKRIKDADMPFYEDDEGNVIMSFKSVATWKDKNGETRTRTIPIFGGAGRIDPKQVPQFGEGTKLRVAYTVSSWVTAAVGAGATLRIDSLKLLDVKLFEASAKDPFGDDDEGYVPDSSGDEDGPPWGDDEDPGQSPEDEGPQDF